MEIRFLMNILRVKHRFGEIVELGGGGVADINAYSYYTRKHHCHEYFIRVNIIK